MAIEFRNSLLGFNKDDVLSYVHLKDSELKNLSNKLNARIDELQKQLESLKAEHLSVLGTVDSLSRENSQLKEQVDEYNKKTEEIETMSANIGRLYLVSKASAKSIVDKSEESAMLVSEHNDMQLTNIDDAQSSLKNIAESILSASKSFVSRLDEFESSLNEVKGRVNENTTQNVKISEEFAEIYAKLG